MKSMYNIWFLKYFIYIFKACFVCVMDSKRLLTTLHSFNYTNVSLKCLQSDQTDLRSETLVQWFAAGGRGGVSVNSRDSRI